MCQCTLPFIFVDFLLISKKELCYSFKSLYLSSMVDQGRSSELCGGAGMFVEAVTPQQHLFSILEEDFIELDDLT